MCGIAGEAGSVVRGGPAPVMDQLRLISHRGPDARGVFDGGRAVVGQARLSVIDLETGDPPVMNEDATIGCVLNGEIYNYRELRRELIGRGHVLGTRGDTEVIAHLSEELEAAELAASLDGMFAFAVWDQREERLILARDRVGKKPLYFWQSAGGLVFASEIKAVLAHPAVPRELNERAIPAYVTFGYVPTPHTFFEGVTSLPPGHVLVWQRGRACEPEPFWTPPLNARRNGSRGATATHPAKAAQIVRGALVKAVERRLVSDVPLGAFLSGGIDSSAVVAITASLVGPRLSTFTMGFDGDDGFDERPYARQVARRYATDHHEFVTAPDAVDLVERLVWHHDQPFGDSSAIPTFLLSEAISRTVTVALSGDGGDELFAGYERFAAALLLERYRSLPWPARNAVRMLADSLPSGSLGRRGERVGRFARAADLPLPDAYREWLSFMPERKRTTYLIDPSGWGLSAYQAVWDGSAGAHTLDRLLDLNLRTYLVDDLLVKLDRMSMAHGLEVRCPLLDTQLLDLALQLPPQLKVKGLSLKRVLRESVKDLLPEAILSRPKRGFGVPLGRWFREDLKNYVGGTLGANDARVAAHVKPDSLHQLIGEHQRGTRDHGQLLWMLLTLEVFLRNEGW